jgi:hypothetical protein
VGIILGAFMTDLTLCSFIFAKLVNIAYSYGYSCKDPLFYDSFPDIPLMISGTDTIYIWFPEIPFYFLHNLEGMVLKLHEI